MIEFTDLVSQSYAVVARYYQPDDVGFPVNVTVDVNGVMYTGYFDAPYCPNTAGCNRLVWFITCLCCQMFVLSDVCVVRCLCCQRS